MWEAHQASRLVHVPAQGKKTDVPEEAKEPVIDTAEDARHGRGTGAGSGLGVCSSSRADWQWTLGAGAKPGNPCCGVWVGSDGRSRRGRLAAATGN